MKNVNDIRADILAAMQAAAEPESGDLNKSADQVLADAIEGYLTASTATASKSAPKAKTIKEKGIALCHQAQGYSANLRPVSLMMKADVSTLTPEQIEALKRLGYAINGGKLEAE
ncbi:MULTISPECIES: hypothetical protein [Enterobacter]|uniref:Phage protein n=1 Tax=Enterobacter dykesii TaxID=2797506 RepID=A0AAU7IXN7_9ENTR|nr:MULTISPECIES: hypothetical protein [Enterobacter]MCU3015120.1 hypothetical protein [Enterobacter hormaechei subsp. oharae]EMB6146068.1 hypothetical protein [Enterobacter asburiae]MCU3616621.1 hypothetical protein [Enterobacter hormaechei subsp. oharae]CZU21547.1 Uncharacterised protein [Enterobacter hormaechei]CZU23655.1 Uncharacterised protein [Enterobacter hormaechei]